MMKKDRFNRVITERLSAKGLSTRKLSTRDRVRDDSVLTGSWVAPAASPLIKGRSSGECHASRMSSTHGLRGRQQGVALVVALVLLVIVTLVGLAAIRGTSLQEKMAGNTFDRAQAFQVASAALDFAARTILPPATSPNPATFTQPGINNCASQYCAENPATDSAITLADWTTIPTSTTGTGAIGTLVSAYGNNPSYIIQYMGTCSVSAQGNFVFTNDQNNQGGGNSLQSVGQCYRITARSNTPGAGAPPADRSQVVLQAIYRTS